MTPAEAIEALIRETERDLHAARATLRARIGSPSPKFLQMDALIARTRLKALEDVLAAVKQG